MKKKAILLVLVSVTAGRVFSQETGYGPGYQTIISTNPAFAGSEGDGTLRLVYLNFYPGQNYNLHSFFASYDSFFPLLHGGAAAFLSNDYMGGALNDLRGGLSYSYHLQAGRNIFINAGLSAAFFHRGFNFSKMIFPDQIDPLGGVVYSTAERPDIKGKTVFDVGAGFLLMSGRYTAAVSVNHLAAPNLSMTGKTEQKIGRELIIHLSGLFSTGKEHRLNIRPLVYGDFQTGRLILGAGSSLETGIISFNAMILGNKAKDVDLQAGIFINSGVFTIFYDYSFNFSSANNLLPFSLVHNAGITVRLNNVDKRKIIKAINFPKC